MIAVVGPQNQISLCYKLKKNIIISIIISSMIITNVFKAFPQQYWYIVFHIMVTCELLAVFINQKTKHFFYIVTGERIKDIYVATTNDSILTTSPELHPQDLCFKTNTTDKRVDIVCDNVGSVVLLYKLNVTKSVILQLCEVDVFGKYVPESKF